MQRPPWSVDTYTDTCTGLEEASAVLRLLLLRLYLRPLPGFEHEFIVCPGVGHQWLQIKVAGILSVASSFSYVALFAVVVVLFPESSPDRTRQLQYGSEPVS